MVQKTTVTLIDDLDDSVTEDVQSVTFAHEGKAFEIDLGPEGRATLEELLAPYKTAGRRAGRATAATPAAPRSRSASDAKVIREWATTKGITISPRGRIPEDIRAQYLADRS